MTDAFVMHDLFLPTNKIALKSVVKPLGCYICKKELNGISITARVINGKTVFLCPMHINSDLKNLIPVI